MKASTLLILCFALTIFSCNRIPEEERVLVKSETDSVLVVAVPNAGCVNCQSIMEGSLDKESGVKQTILNLHTKEVSIVYEPNLVTPESLEKKVQSLRRKLPCK